MALRAGGLTGLMNQPSAQVIDGSLKFDSDAKTYITRTPGSAGNRKKFTYSCWLKRFEFGAEERFLEIAIDGNNQAGIKIQTNNQIQFFDYDNGSYVYNLQTDQVFRDTGWYHIVYAVDTTQAYSSDRVKIYVNGKQVKDFSTESYPSQNVNARITNSQAHEIGRYGPSDAQHLGARMSQVYLIDGLRLGPGFFGFTDPLTGTWRPKRLRQGDSTANDGTTWSSVVTATGSGAVSGINGSYPVTGAFDTNSSTYLSTSAANISSNPAILTVTFPPGSQPSFFSDVVVTVGGSNTDTLKISFNGSPFKTVVNPSAAFIPHTFATGSGTISEIKVSRQKANTNAGGAEIQAIFVDGVQLLDSTTTNVDFGTTGFYLPMDGNSPIGQDKSGKGNNWTPINFGGSVALDNPTASGALPILNTTQGGTQALPGTRTDANASSLILALPLVGDKEDIHHLIKGSGSAKTVTNNNVTFNSISHFYGGSALFNSSSDYLRLDSSPFDYGSGDFTMEFWCYLDGSFNTARHVISAWQDGGNQTFYLGTGGANGYWGSFGVKIGGTQYEVNGDAGKGRITRNGWHHIAGVRDGTNIKLFVDGNLIGTTACGSGSMISLPSYVYIGKHYSASGYEWQGNLSDLRIYKGVAKYTSNFVPASTSPDILPDTPSGVAGGSKLTKITDGAVSFDGTGDYLSLADNDDIDLTGDISFTVEAFIYKTDSAEDQIFEFRGGGSTGWTLYTTTSNTLQIYDSVANTQVGTSTGKITPNAWNHIALTKNGSGSNNCNFWINGVNSGTFSLASFATTDSTGLRIGASKDTSSFFTGFMSNVRILKGTALYTSNFTPSSAPLTNVTNTKLLCCQSNTSAVDTTVVPGTAPNTRNWSARTNWNSGGTLTNASSYPLTAAFDGNLNTTFAMSYAGGMIWTAPSTISFSSSIEVYVNSSIGTGGQGFIATISGVQQSKVDLNAAGSWETLYSGSGTFDKLEITRNNGGNNNNLWISAIRVDGTVLVDAIAANGDAVATTFNPFNTDIKTVLGQETGYATWNPLKMGTSSVSMSEGNLFWRTTSNGPDKCTYSTIGMDSGKWYWENEVVEATATAIGIANVHANQDAGPANAHNWMYYSATGQVYLDGSASSYGAAFNTNGTIIGVAFDRDNLTLEFYKNGISQGKLTSISGLTDSETYFAMCGDSGGASQSQVRVNFGQKPFKFPPPNGFQPLNAANVRPETVISRPDQFVGVTTYTGTTGGGTIKDDNINFTPDFVWVKNRTSAEDHKLYDTVRGESGGNFYNLESNTTAAQTAESGAVTSMIEGGFTSTGGGHVNSNGAPFVSWMWKAGGNKNTFNVDDVGYASAAAAGLDGGTATVTGASVGTKQGFSIIKYTTTTGAGNFTVSHGLSEAPTFIITRKIASGNWVTGHDSVGWTKYLFLNSTAAESTNANAWGNISPTSSVFGGNDSNFYGNGVEQISYIWHDVPGLQKFGTYEGTGVAGNYVHLGFRPALIWIKNVDNTSINNWGIIDSTRSYANVGNHTLATNLNNAESSFGGGESVFGASNKIDLLSDGFRLQETSGFGNTSGITFLYCAWAEAPAFNLYGGQSNAR